eukprot:g16681.t2
MCYRSCGKLKASASNSCNAGFLADPSGLRQKNLKERKLITFWPDKVVVDRVYAIGAVYKKPQMTIYKLVSPGACKYRFEMMGQIVSKKSSSKFATLSGYISGCDVPDFIKLSPGEDLRITTAGKGKYGKSKASPSRGKGKTFRREDRTLLSMRCSFPFAYAHESLKARLINKQREGGEDAKKSLPPEPELDDKATQLREKLMLKKRKLTAHGDKEVETAKFATAGAAARGAAALASTGPECQRFE